ncbi:MAG: hypothetical protein JWO38_2236 [Gemmataceae bacterium]|nr:hypothetical protein [Gemmataceae bacterium]
MPAIATGDIFYWTSGPGHIGMAYDDKNVIHAQMKGNFHVDTDQQNNNGQMSYLSDTAGMQIFRPPWEKLGAGADAKKAELRRVAELISRRTEYGAYRAIRLFLGDSSFGPGAATRLQKYRDRLLAGTQPIIKTVTCSEAVIITYQLSFPLSEAPFFIRLDGAHAMPGTLATWLRTNGWATIKS